MFTGIVAAVGRIEIVERLGEGVRLRVEAADLDLSSVRVGDSIAIQGACMTATAVDGSHFSVDVSAESLSKTVGLDTPGRVNLELALTLAQPLGGHLVSGHVDGLGEVARLDPVGESWAFDVRVPATLARYLAYKGSVTINGVSLTVNAVSDEADASVVRINLIPHTMASTTLGDLRAGSRVNVEVDLIARYCERMLGLRQC